MFRSRLASACVAALGLGAGTTSSALAQMFCASIAWNTYTTANGPNLTVRGMTPYNGRLVARGGFSSVAGVPANNIAAFNGTSWEDISQGFTLGRDPTSFFGMVTHNGALYVAGPLTVSTNPLRRAPGQYYDGTAWQTIPMPGLYTASATHLWSANGLLYAWGNNFVFADANGNPTGTNRHLVVYSGLGWSGLGPQFGPNSSAGNLSSLVGFDGDIYISGSFTTLFGPPNVPAEHVARYSGGVWSQVGTGLNTGASLVVFRNELYACGGFTATGDGATPLSRFAKWNGSAWVQVAGGLSVHGAVLVGDDGRGPALFIFMTGTAFNTEPGYPPSVVASGLVRFDGVGFTPAAPIGAAPVESFTSIDLGLSSAIFIGLNNRVVGGGGPGYLAHLGPIDAQDTDADGLLDHWETMGQGLDVDCDTVPDLDLHALGATPDHKDIFVEVDAMTGMLADPSELNDVVAAFAVAPVGNPDNQTGIRLHVLIDETIPVEPFPNEFQDFFRIKTARFGTPADRMGPNSRQVLDAKRKVYRYCLFADRLADASSGFAELPGNDFMVTFGAWTSPVSRGHRTGTFMHELGHTLGLKHGGGQEDLSNDRRFNYKPNYHSVMNYSWQFPERFGWVLDYSREVRSPLDESALIETAGLGGIPAFVALIGPPPAVAHSESGPIDYNRDGTVTAEPVAADINHVYPGDPASPGDVLLGHIDWTTLRYNFRTTDGYAEGAAAHTTEHTEMTFEIFEFLRQFGGPPPCPADFNNDAFVNSQDFFDFLTAFFVLDPAADFNGDALINSQDFFDFLAAFFGGC